MLEADLADRAPHEASALHRVRSSWPTGRAKDSVLSKWSPRHRPVRPNRVLRARLDKNSRSIDQLVSERGKEPPVALFVRSRQRRSSDPRAKPQMICQTWLRAQAGLYIAQALAKRHLREGQCKKVIPRRKLPPAVGLIVCSGQSSKLPVRYTSHDLGEGHLACVHGAGYRPKSLPGSNREQP